MKFLTTIISGIFIFSPPIIFGYYLAYMYGVTETFASRPSSLGISYSEYLFLGYFELSTDVLKILNKLLRIILYITLYCLACYLCLFFGTHSSSREKLKSKFDFLQHRIHKFSKNNKLSWLKNINSIPAAIYLLFIFFIFSLYPVLIKYKQGEKEATELLRKTITSYQCEYNEGYMKDDYLLKRIKKITCGSHKCLMISLNDYEIRTILPEQYIQPLSPLVETTGN
ncbi:hypothetical protein [Acinetobacter sp. WZC-1]|uniref:hypothetical protein n=1 Tax=Acinetobacter sp. WZC-1 TaxID=3459034 RepID=UPI00403D9778